MRKFILLTFLFVSSFCFSQTAKFDDSPKINELDSLSKVYNVKVWARMRHYTKDGVITMVQTIRPCEKYPQGLWYYIDGKNLIPVRN